MNGAIQKAVEPSEITGHWYYVTHHRFFCEFLSDLRPPFLLLSSAHLPFQARGKNPGYFKLFSGGSEKKGGKSFHHTRIVDFLGEGKFREEAPPKSKT